MLSPLFPCIPLYSPVFFCILLYAPVILCIYRIYSNKGCGAYLIFRSTSAALIGRRRLFKNCSGQIYFFYIFIQWYTFYLLIFLWNYTKLIVKLI